MEKLIQIIEQNPDCQFSIDNDCWYIYKHPSKCDGSDADVLAKSSDFSWNTDWYSDSSNYGVGLAEVLLTMLNRRGFSLTANAV